MKNILFALLLSAPLFAKYDNCVFKNKDYMDICENVVKNGVSYEYANKFLLSYFKTKKFDEVSYKYLQPKYIKTHKKNEKKANNVLVKYVPDMVAHLKEYAEVYDFTEKKYGVNREIIAAILIKETKLGKIKPTHDAFIVFNTLVVRTEPNSPREKWLLKMGKTNMASIITHCYKKGVTPEECNLPSSYAGAVGIPQFMPNSFVYAHGYKTKIADLTKMEDAIVSAANFLHQKADFS
ncbi:MAG TPA: lytic murein transglycosylase, partial [Sulfurimonas sp.]